MNISKADSIEEFKERLTKQRKKLLTSTLIFLFLVALVIGFYLYDQKRLRDSKELETEAYRYLAGLIKDSNLTEEQRFTKAAELFLEAHRKKSNISYLLNAGYAYSIAGKKDRAVETLNRVFEMNDERFSNLAKIKIAMIYLGENDKDRAISSFNEILNSKHEIMKDFAYFQLAKIHEKDKREEALKYYELLIKNYPQSPLAEEAKSNLAKIKP